MVYGEELRQGSRMATVQRRQERLVGIANSMRYCVSIQSQRDSTHMPRRDNQRLLDSSVHHTGPTEVLNMSAGACERADLDGFLRRCPEV